MSKNPNDPIVITSVPETEEETSAVAKQSIASRGWNYVKEHKKTAAAAVGLGALVVVSTVVGRKTASDPDVYLFELESPEETDTEVLESVDTTVA